MKGQFKSALMECVYKTIRVRRNSKWERDGFAKNVIRCKRAEQTGNYKVAYSELLKLFSKHLNHFRTMESEPSNNLTLVYNIPYESVGEDHDVMLATAAVYNLRKMGFIKPPQQYGWRSRLNGQFYLRADRGHEHLGEIRISNEDEYDNPLLHYPQLNCDHFNKPKISSEQTMRFNLESYDEEFKIEYKVVTREWKHNYVFLKCDNHYYVYTWQFCQG